MGHLSWGDIASILGSLAAIFGGIRWLLSVYFKMQIKIDAARKVAFAAQATLLHQEVEQIKQVIRFHKADLEAVSLKIDAVMKEFSNSQEMTNKVYEAFREFIISAKQRFEFIENGKHTASDKMNVSSKVEVKEDPKPNIGKVIVKK